MKREDIIKTSFKRSKDFGVDRDKEIKPFSFRKGLILINSGGPFMDLAAEAFKECGSILVLVDTNGYVLKLYVSHSSFHMQKHIRLRVGLKNLRYYLLL